MSREHEIMACIDEQIKGLTFKEIDNLLSEVMVNIELLYLHPIRGTKPKTISYEEAIETEKKCKCECCGQEGFHKMSCVRSKQK